MPRNVEIKARLADPAATRRLAADAADGPPQLLEQTDTFFRIPAGRLKLREQGAGRAELIFYRRPDTRGPSESHFERVAVADSAALRGVLASALGVAGTVTKRRLLYRVGRTRVHLDEVEGLGHFLELEVEMAPGEAAEAGAIEADRLMRRLGVHGEALVAEAYVDLIAGQSEKVRR